MIKTAKKVAGKDLALSDGARETSTPPPGPLSPLLQLGERIRRLRHERRWSLGDLGERSMIATSTLSKVENGRLSLAYDRLLLVAQAFDLTLSEFLAEDCVNAATPAAIARVSWARRHSGQRVDSAPYTYHYLCTNLRAKRMVPILSTLKAHSLAEFGPLLRHEGEEFVLVLRGRVEVHTEVYAPEVLNTQEGVYIDSRMGHAYLNAGLGEALILSVNTSPIPQEAAGRSPLNLMTGKG